MNSLTIVQKLTDSNTVQTIVPPHSMPYLSPPSKKLLDL